MKKIFLLLIILIFILSINLSFADNSTDVLTNTLVDDEVLDDSIGQVNIYVSNDGSDSLGNGTYENPYQTIDYTINIASNNSNIYLKSGTYNSTGQDIVNKSISINGLGDVTIDSRIVEVSQNTFKINNGSSLILNNIKFVNDYADFELIHCINNEGELYINNCYFSNFSTTDALIKNNNYLYLNNVSGIKFSVSINPVLTYYGISVINFANIDIYNSCLLSIYNYDGRINVNNSNISRLNSNRTFININNSVIGSLNDYNSNIIVNNSNVTSVQINNSTFIINNSCLAHSFTFDFSNVSVYYSSLLSDYIFGSFSNFTTEYSIFPDFICKFSNVNAHYCSILKGYLTNCTGNVDYNWWGNNNGPIINSQNILNYWIIMTFENKNSNIEVSLNKYTDGTNIESLNDAYKLPTRMVTLETESGYFSKNNGNLLNGTFKTSLIDNNPDTIIYAVIDNQELRLLLGNGYTNYTIYVSDTNGNDYYNDGSINNPYKTLLRAVSKALSGNTIYILSGNYTLRWNANLKINKNLTIVGLGNVQLLRPNSRNIFIVQDKGVLNIENINFTSATSEKYYDSLIVLEGGSLNIKNCNFYDIITKSVIMTEKSEFINIDNVSFNDIEGQAILGSTNNLIVSNSIFTNGTPSYVKNKIWGFDKFNQDPEAIFDLPITHFYITINADSTIINTTFKDNDIGAIYTNCNNIEFSSWICNRNFNYSINTYIYNSTFENNKWNKNIPVTGLSTTILIGLSVANKTINGVEFGNSTVDGCYFNNNAGRLIYASIINNSEFVNNTPDNYYYFNPGEISFGQQFPLSLIKADLINNSYFYGNSDLSGFEQESIINCPEVYYSTFINNSAAYGGALFNPSEVHYCVFINNTATYGGNDIFLYSGVLNASSNWWGSNQKPSNDRIYIFIGTLILDDWVVMSLDYKDGNVIASLNNLLDDNGKIYKLNHLLPSRNVIFSTDDGILNINNTYLINNYAYSKLLKNFTSDFNIYAKIDFQELSLSVYNNSTLILVKNMTLYGKNNPFEITLVNVNGHRVSNQILNVVIYKDNLIQDTFTLNTNEVGEASFDFDYPIGYYKIKVYYAGNGYFEKSEAISYVNLSPILTRLTSYNFTYYGKNNKIYAILQDRTGGYVLNQNLELKIYDSNNKLISTSNVITGSGGRADVLLSLGTGLYRLKWTFMGNEWYENSSCESEIKINPINTTINLFNTTFFGKGNNYEFTFKDAYGTLIRGETIILTLSKGNEFKEFKLVTDDKGVASITINLEPGIYNVDANYVGDEIYGSSKSSAILEIQPIQVTFDLNSNSVIPENGVFTVILVDMYGKKVSGERVSLDLYNYELLKSFYATTDGNGEANFRINMPEGSYFGILNYNGNVWYKKATGASKITVNPNVVLNNIYISGNDLVQYYGENKYFVINFNDSNAYSLGGKIIQVTISSKDWSNSYNIESDIFGKARLKITLDPGIYNITYKYANEYYDIHGEGSNSIFVYKMPTTLLAQDLIMNYGEAQYYEVKLADINGMPLSNLLVNILIDDMKYTVITNQKGVAKILVNLDLGYHNITYSFNSDYYESSNGSSKILVVDGSKTATKINGSNIESREYSLFNYSVMLSDLFDLPIKSSEIILNITDLDGNLIGKYIGFTNLFGVSNFNLNLSYGKYLFNTYYMGNNNYLASFNTNTVNIKALENVSETILFGSDFSIINGDNSTNYFVILSTVDGELLKNQSIEFIIKDNSYYSLTDDLGKAYLNIPFSPGSYKIISRFNGSNNLTKASVTNYISVQREICQLYSKDIVKSFNNATQYYVALVDANNLPLANKTIKFIINNGSYERLTDKNGFACFDVDLNPGIYNITAIYQGNFTDEYAQAFNKITVLNTLLSENITKYYDGNTMIIAFFFNFKDDLLSNTNVIYNINGVNYKVKTDEYGMGVLDINLKPGNYNLKVLNTLTGEIGQYNIKILSTLTTKNIIKYYKSSNNFQATFKDTNGNPLKNTYVKFVINGKTYKVKTNSKGFATLKTNLNPGKYKVITINTKTGEKKTNTFTIKTTIITKNKKVKVGKTINFQAKILKTNGKIAKKVKIKFKINKKTYKIKTNSKGIAKLNIKLKKGSYTISTSYNGLTVKNKITVK